MSTESDGSDGKCPKCSTLLEEAANCWFCPHCAWVLMKEGEAPLPENCPECHVRLEVRSGDLCCPRCSFATVVSVPEVSARVVASTRAETKREGASDIVIRLHLVRVEGDPAFDGFSVEVLYRGSWTQSFGTEGELRAFFRGLQVGGDLGGVVGISLPEIPRAGL